MGISMSGGITPSGSIKLTSNNPPTWTTASGTIGTEDELTVISFQFEASDPEQGTSGLTFTKISGDFPAGLSMGSAGSLTGTASDVESDTTSNFSLRVVDSGGLFADRAFSMTISNVILAAPKSLWMMGQNYAGQLGLGDTNDRSSPVQVGLTDWADVSTNNASVGVKSDGTLWSWGINDGYSSGVLGLGDILNRSSPVQVGNLTTWASVSAGRAHHSALKTDGTLWTWGRGANGRLGQGDSDSRSSPVQVGSNWAIFNSGQDSTLAIKTDGTLWAWGWARSGQLANNSITIDQSSPVQIGAFSNWVNVSRGGLTIAAINTAGELWVWGRGGSGQMGQGDNASRSSPVQIAGSNWASASVGSSRCAAVKTDGSLWSWGSNSQGQLGLGDTANRSSPVQVGSLTDWASIDCGSNTILAVKTNGTLWGWGQNSNGRIGDGTIIKRSSPVQIGLLTTWASVSSGIPSSALRNE